MKVILKQAVPKVGKEGTVVNIADGFARNYLFPRGLAIVAEKKQVAALAKRHERVAAKSTEEKSQAEALRDRIQGAVVRIPAQVGGDKSRLFGAVTAQDVHDAIVAQLKATIDRRKIALIEPIKRLGSFPVDLDLHRDVDARITVEVYDPNAPVAAPAPSSASAEEPEDEE